MILRPVSVKVLFIKRMRKGGLYELIRGRLFDVLEFFVGISNKFIYFFRHFI